ncbi:MAG: hypothetical protein GY874_09265 [Desulfobacteraceae bacterium]|nr:hypothetical protein [Desulfobacteraceae bacterium]
MKKKILTFTAVFLVLVSIAGGSLSHAGCIQSGKIFYMYYNNSTTEPYAYIYLTPFTTFAVNYYYYVTYDTDLMAALSSAFSGGETVRLYGDATECATTGTARNGGTILYTYMYKNY